MRHETAMERDGGISSPRSSPHPPSLFWSPQNDTPMFAREVIVELLDLTGNLPNDAHTALSTVDRQNPRSGLARIREST
jgi:hypothetical protein